MGVLGTKVMTDDEKLGHSLKLKFGLAPYEPTANQLTSIKAAIQRIRDSGQRPTDSDWGNAVYAYCPGAGTCRYSGLDNSDLNALLAVAIANARRN